MPEDRLTSAVQSAIAEAQQVAITRHHQEIDIPEFFKVIIQPGEFGADLFQRTGINVGLFEKEIDEQLDRVSVVEGQVSYGQNFSQNLARLIQEAEQLRQKQGDEYIALDTVILALMKLKNHPLKIYLEKQGLTEKN